MNTWSKTKKTCLLLMTAIISTIGMSSCDDAIYDYEGDCSVNYRIKFRYDYNMKFADAFAHEVNTVTLWMLDEDGNVVLKKTESGEALAQEDYAMTVEVQPGTYSLLAWAGTADKGSFIIPDAQNGKGITCTLERNYNHGGFAYVDEDLDRLFHGYLPNQEFGQTEGTFYYTVPLVKNTNNVRVVLQHISGEPVDKDKFQFTITDTNGKMDWDNTVLPDEEITYKAWLTQSGVAGTTDEYANARGSHAFSAAIAELTVPRLMTNHKPRLTVTNSETGATVFSIPLIDYALLVKGFYNREMGDQEYLDRQDEYNMTFFLDEGYRWIDSYIYINSWKIVLQNSEI